MDVKNVIQSIVPLQLRPKEAIEKSIETSSTTDRDANGQMQQDGREHHPPMTDEQFQEALEHLRNLSTVKEHGLIVEAIVDETHRVVHIKEPNGTLFRRISEDELWSLIKSTGKDKGQLLSKTA